MTGSAHETPQEAAKRLAYPVLSKGFKPQALHTYRDAAGEPIYWRVRAKHPETGEKWIRPMHLNGDGYQLGEPKWGDSLKPLYKLNRVVGNVDDPVFIVEGEWAADHLTRIGILATTSGSADSADRADWTPLMGRKCVVWRDLDEAGASYEQAVVARLTELGCVVERVDVDKLGLPSKGDAFDWMEAHPACKAEDILALPRVAQAPAAVAARVDEEALEPAINAGPGEGPRPILRRFSEIHAKPIRWLWPGRIARGKVSMLAGNPGLGKSQITASMAAVVTQGGTWPVDRTKCERGSVIFLSAEDDPEDTIRPRLEAAGADLSRCLILEAVADGFTAAGTEIRRSFNLKTDLQRLGEAMTAAGDVALVVIDPISAYLGGTDSHNNADVRALLAPLADLAAQHGAAIVGVSHLNKGGKNDALMRVTGSLAFVAAARSAFVVVADKDAPARRLFLPIKNNIGPDSGGLAFAIETANVPTPAGRVESSRVVWEPAPVTITADEAMAPPLDAEERSDLDDAVAFLRDMLSDGPVASKRIQAESHGAGHSWATMRRAQKALKIEATKGGMKEGWVWRLPPDEPPKMLKSAEDAHTNGVSAFGKNEHLRAEGIEAETF